MLSRRSMLRGSKARCLLLFLVGFLCVLLWVSYVLSERGSPVVLEVESKKNLKASEKNRQRKLGPNKSFLAWTTKSGKSKWIPNNLRSLRCEFDNCKITEDRGKLATSDVVIFHSKDVNLKDLPKTRPQGQIWVYLNHEPPTQTTFSVVKQMESLVNITVTYRTDSDIFAPIYDIVENDNSSNYSESSYKGTRKLVTWLVSHCKTTSNREGYVKKLLEFIDVDVWGKCGASYTKCPKMAREECYKQLAEEYKFYLAFENSLCKDYVSEKLYLAMYGGMVPIVFGAANYSRILPPHSYIDALEFESPNALAQYILEVGNSEGKYNEYLHWRRKYTVVQRRYRWLCDLCALLSEDFKRTVRKQDLTKWWFEDAGCKTWSVSYK